MLVCREYTQTHGNLWIYDVFHGSFCIGRLEPIHVSDGWKKKLDGWAWRLTPFSVNKPMGCPATAEPVIKHLHSRTRRRRGSASSKSRRWHLAIFRCDLSPIMPKASRTTTFTPADSCSAASINNTAGSASIGTG